MFRLIGAIFVCFIIIIQSISYKYTNYLAGVWTGENLFLEKSNLKSFEMFISPDLKNGYIIMVDADGNVVFNNTVHISYRRSMTGIFKPIYSDQYDIVMTMRSEDATMPFEDATMPFEDSTMPFEDTMYGTISMTEGLKLFSSKKIYAYLLKDSAASLSAISFWKFN